MSGRARYTTDPTIPGLSPRDWISRAIDNVSINGDGRSKAGRRREFVIRHDLERLDRETLRDLGLDRDRAA
jgi:hypothetical protein